MTRNPPHAFSNGKLYPLTSQPAECSLLGRLRTALVRRIMAKIEKEQARLAIDQFLTRAEIGEDTRITRTAWCHNSGPKEHVIIGAHSICRGLIRIEDFKRGHLRLGDFTHIGDDCILSCAERIDIGNGCMLAHGVQIFDNNSHPVDAFERERDYKILLRQAEPPRPAIATAPVVLGERVWIGMQSIVLKGVTIGENTIVAAGSVVSRSLPANVIAAGNPAAPVRNLIPGEKTL